MADNNTKITLMALVMMIFTTVFGFANSTVAYFLMGYSSILFYLAAAILFFIPFALMMAEMGPPSVDEEWDVPVVGSQCELRVRLHWDFMVRVLHHLAVFTSASLDSLPRPSSGVIKRKLCLRQSHAGHQVLSCLGWCCDLGL